MRSISRQLLGCLLIVPTLVAAERPFYMKKDFNKPEKIGRRTVAPKSIISPEKEIAIGRQYAVEIERTAQLVKDASVEGYVAAVAERVGRNSDLKGAVTLKVAISPEVNSVSLPAGWIYLTSSLLLWAENEDEIAGAIAHQVAHTAARTWASQLTKAQIMQYANIPLIFPTDFNPNSMTYGIAVQCAGFLPHPPQNTPRSLVSQGMSFGIPMGFLNFNRQAELEADYLGLQYMYKAGYDPRIYVAMLQKFLPANTTSKSVASVFDATPPVSQRIAQAEEEIRTILTNPPSPSKPSPEFVLMKSRLKELAQPPAPAQPPEGAPTFRRPPAHEGLQPGATSPPPVGASRTN